MEESTEIAEVIRVANHPVVEIAEGVEVGGCTVYAKINDPVQKYRHCSFTVQILKPIGLSHIQREKGLRMEHGQFSFDSGEELKVGDKLEILISAVPPENLL
jgi:hypothetical protein